MDEWDNDKLTDSEWDELDNLLKKMIRTCSGVSGVEKIEQKISTESIRSLVGMFTDGM